MTSTPLRSQRLTELLRGFSVEMTGKDIDELESADIPAGTRINVTFLGNEDLAMRVAAARAVKRRGWIPVPHVSARRLTSEPMLAEFLSALRAEAAVDEIFVVGGDPSQPHGPYADALSVIRSGLLEKHGVRRVSITGYPEGHPGIPDQVLWPALIDKHAALREKNLTGDVITQFGFDADPVLDWIEQVREHDITSPIRIGVPGPAGVRRLLRFATRFGVGTGASIAKKYGLSLTNLMGTAGPDRFLRTLAGDYHPARHGEVKLHFYTFGGLRATAEWITNFQKEG
ncbi:methylenetetrahydrofolate reductase [Paractinoplanes durhamensis]|uniref:Methylenetetrahydrofolate reductase n=1 Tax=Paractinoplanes durhamensis TaxID=113563 RepID=A0ABQ3ZCG7_9ACTN|nr:methylenetetrahydrofolate reductase [Actinoplanes durhamensis]GIE07553.1 methylenetetrahydrofolate reductase [Actinoplanes durhamensis]